MATIMSARIPVETAEALRARARVEGRTVSDVLARAIQEYLRATRFPGIVFVGGADGRRRARLNGGPDVWEVVLAARSAEWDADKTSRDLQITPTGVRLALAYYGAYPDEIDARLQRLSELDASPPSVFAGIRVFTATSSADTPAA